MLEGGNTIGIFGVFGIEMENVLNIFHRFHLQQRNSVLIGSNAVASSMSSQWNGYNRW